MFCRHSRENESIAVQPLGVLGVELHVLAEKNVGNGGHAHGGTGMAGVASEGGINLDGELASGEEYGAETKRRGSSVNQPATSELNPEEILGKIQPAAEAAQASAPKKNARCCLPLTGGGVDDSLGGVESFKASKLQDGENKLTANRRMVLMAN